MKNARIALLTCATLLGALPVIAQYLQEQSFLLKQESSSAASSRPAGNGITDIVIAGDTIWIGTGKGLSRSVDGGRTWTNYYGTPAFGEEDISAIAVHRNEVWASTAHTTVRNGESLPEGSGLRYSSDGGDTWRTIAQPRDINNIDTLYYNDFSLIRALGVTTTIQNITYDIAATDSAVWIASWAGMIRKSTDNGLTWKRVILPPDNLDHIAPTDTLRFDLSPSSGALGLGANYNHMGFSVVAAGNTDIWVGTAGGINHTTDNGRSWTRFSHQNQTFPIAGNFIVGLKIQNFAGKRTIWGATVNANDSREKRGVSWSDNDGATWKTGLEGEFAHNVGVKDSVVFVCTDNGLFRSADHGLSWSTAGSIFDRTTKEQIRTSKFYTAAARGDSVFLGSNDGLSFSLDNALHPFGSEWHVLRAFRPLASVKDVYAYPNPFSPDDEVVRIHYSAGDTPARVTIRVFDFGMHLVRTIVQNAIRTGELDEVWDGKDDHGRQVANSTYFYHVVVNDGTPSWGKVMVLQ